MAQSGDFALVARTAIFHDRHAFDLLVKKYQSQVRRFFLSQTLGDAPLSDDLAQDTFVKAYTHIATFRGAAGFSTWLMRIAYNVLYDHRRQQERKGGHEDDIDDSAARHQLSASQTPAEGLRMDLYNALALLSPDERTCITLQLIDGLSVAEISKITATNEGTVRSRLSRGKKLLANYLKQNGYG